MTTFVGIEEVSDGYKCPVCGHVSPNVWKTLGHLNDEHPAGKTSTEGGKEG